jgi:hypothetical protein
MDPYYREPTSSATAQRLNAVGPEALSQKAVRLTGDNPKKCGGRRSSIRKWLQPMDRRFVLKFAPYSIRRRKPSKPITQKAFI